MRFLLSAFLLFLPALLLSGGPAESQCVNLAVAGGTADALTVPALPCTPTTTLLMLSVSQTNQTTSPTLSVNGGPAQIILSQNAQALSAGSLTTNGKYLLSYNGANWFLLNTGLGNVFGPASAIVGDLASFSGVGGKNLSDSGVSLSVVLPHFLNNTALGGASTAFPVVVRDSFASLGDTPALLYRLSGSPCPLNGGAGDNGSQVLSSPGKCWIAIPPSVGMDITEWGADKSGVNASETAIQSAFTYACSSGGAITALNGTYKLVSAGLSVSCSDFSFTPQSFNTIFSYVGSGAIDSIILMSGSASDVRLGPITLTGNSHVSYGLHTSNIHRSSFNVRARNVATSGYFGQFGTLNNYWLSCSSSEGAFTTVPANCFLSDTDGVNGGISSGNVFLIAEGLSGSGIKILNGNNNIFRGASKSNAIGYEGAAGTLRNVFDAVDFETNSTADVQDAGTGTQYRDILSVAVGGSGLFHLTGGSGVILRGGNLATLTVDAGATNVTLYPNSVSGVVTLSSTTVDYNGAWLAYTPVIDCAAGTLTSATATGRYRFVGGFKSVALAVKGTITTIGTCATAVQLSLPFTVLTSSPGRIFVGRDTGLVGEMISGTLTGGTTTMQIFKNDGTFVGANGSLLNLDGIYETQ